MNSGVLLKISLLSKKSHVVFVLYSTKYRSNKSLYGKKNHQTMEKLCRIYDSSPGVTSHVEKLWQML